VLPRFVAHREKREDEEKRREWRRPEGGRGEAS
jgi:ribosomal protein L39E